MTQNSHLNFEYKILCQPNLSPPTNQSATKSLLSTKDKTREKNASSLQVFFQRTATKIQKKLPRTTLTTRIRTTLPKKGLQLLLKRRKKPKVDIKFPKVPTLLCIGDLIILEFFCLLFVSVKSCHKKK